MTESKLSTTQLALEKFGGKYALSWPVAILSFLWASNISISYDATRFNTSRTGWFLASVLAHVILILLAAPIRYKLLPVVDRPSKPILALTVFAVLGVTRSLLMGEFAVYLNLAPTQEYGYRQITGFISITAGLAVTVILVASVAERQKTLSALLAQRQRLTEIKQQSEVIFETNQKELTQIIEESIKPSLDEIKVQLDSANFADQNMVSRTGQLITELINDRLRPISDSLHQPTAAFRQDQVRTISRVPKVRSTTKISIRALINPFLVSILMMAVTIAGSIYYAGFAAVPIALSVFLPFLFIMLVARRFTPISWQLNIWAALPISILGHMIAALPSFLLIDWIGNYFDGIKDQLFTAVIGFAFIATVLVLVRAVETEELIFENDFRKANNEAQNVLNNLNQRIWLARRNTAQLLHGSVQAALTAANVRLKQGQLSESDFVKVQNDIERAIGSLTSEIQLELDIENEIEDLIDLWDGVCQIDVTINEQTVKKLNDDLIAAQCVNEFLKECVNNAIKHGQATEVEAVIAADLVSEISISVENNGLYLPENQAGLGTRILDEIAINWARTRSDQGTLVRGRIALVGGKNLEDSSSESFSATLVG